MSRLYSVHGQQFSLLAAITNNDLDDDQVDQLADLEPGEEVELEKDGVQVTFKREE